VEYACANDFEVKKKPVAPIPNIYIGKRVWAGKSLIRVVSAMKVVASGCMEGSVIVRVAGQRRSVIEGILTCEAVTLRRTLT